MQTAVLESALPFSSKKAMSKSSGENGQDFEFCEVCRLNHDQGRRHKYFPSHARALAAVLARFHGKLSDIRFFLRNPSSLSPEHAVLNRLWCLFCRCDLRELGSSFACSNTIKHLASSEHLRNLKEFLRKHGGGMDRVDSFRVSEAELLKWEKGCETLNNATTSSCERSIGPSTGSSKEMRIMIINMIRQLVDPQLEVSSHILLLLGPWIYRGILAFPAPMSLVVFQGIYQTDILHVLPVMQKA